MKPQKDVKIMAEHEDAYPRADGGLLATIRREYLKEIGMRAAIALIVLACIAALGSHNYGGRTRGDTALVGIVVGVPLYILYKLLVMKRATMAAWRQRLVTPATHKIEDVPQSTSRFTNRLIPLLWVIVLVVIAGVAFAIWWTGRTGIQKAGNFATFSGTVTARNNGCAYDDVCTVSVDDRVIVTGGGLTANPNANIYGTTDNDLRIGDKVNVKARSTDYGLTLRGCKDCFITRSELQR